MATVLKKLVPARGKYPWKLWTNGRAYQAVEGKDFNCSRDGFRSALYSIARRRKLSVTVALKGKAVEFQFSKS